MFVEVKRCVSRQALFSPFLLFSSFSSFFLWLIELKNNYYTHLFCFNKETYLLVILGRDKWPDLEPRRQLWPVLWRNWERRIWVLLCILSRHLKLRRKLYMLARRLKKERKKTRMKHKAQAIDGWEEKKIIEGKIWVNYFGYK